MKKFVCCPQGLIPKEIDEEISYFSLYSSLKPRRKGVGHIALNLKTEIRRAGFAPSVQAWDFTSIALSIAAVDMSYPRKKSADGWTRQIELDICLKEPLMWVPQRGRLESTLCFLTGDFWKLNFYSGGDAPPVPTQRQLKSYDADCVSLLSGGVDSLVGAIDLTASGRQPLFVSKVVTGDKDIQRDIAVKLGATDRHIQWSYARRPPYEAEGSTRGRSIIFFAFAALAASAIEKSTGPVSIYVPENGFISQNVALTPGRLGALSTKTTHPVYLKGLQHVWDRVGINATLGFPYDYQFRTKGELLAGCKNKNLLLELIPESTSCGRYGTYKKTHCGRCVPCLVRRAAFLKAEMLDVTTISTAYQRQYVFPDLSKALLKKSSMDIRAIASAYLRYKDKGINRFVGGALSFSSPEERVKYEGVVARGLDELGQLLKNHGVL